MSDLKIEKNIPMPPPHKSQRSKKYGGRRIVVEQMQIGDSVLLPDRLYEDAWRVWFRREAVRLGWRFEFRVDNASGGLRAWRTQ